MEYWQGAGNPSTSRSDGVIMSSYEVISYRHPAPPHSHLYAWVLGLITCVCVHVSSFFISPLSLRSVPLVCYISCWVTHRPVALYSLCLCFEAICNAPFVFFVFFATSILPLSLSDHPQGPKTDQQQCWLSVTSFKKMGWDQKQDPSTQWQLFTVFK